MQYVLQTVFPACGNKLKILNLDHTKKQHSYWLSMITCIFTWGAHARASRIPGNSRNYTRKRIKRVKRQHRGNNCSVLNVKRVRISSAICESVLLMFSYKDNTYKGYFLYDVINPNPKVPAYCAFSSSSWTWVMSLILFIEVWSNWAFLRTVTWWNSDPEDCPA